MKLDNKRKTFVELVGVKNTQTRVVGGVLPATRMDIQSVGVLEENVIKIRVEEGGVSAVGMDGKSMEVQEEDKMKARVEEKLFRPSGWLASPGTCRRRT